ncbi:MAG: PrsW family intramembrane metalloprotease [bacterium]
MLIFASFIAAIVPMFLYLIILWRMDRNERELFSNVLRHFLWGALGAIFFGIVFSQLLSIPFHILIQSPEGMSLAGAVIIAPFVEEIAKGAFLLKTVRNKYFDNATDGLVYGGAIGLGFGMTENFLYFITYGDTIVGWVLLVIIRSIFSAVMHCIATATFGSFLGRAKFGTPGKKYFYPLIGLGIAMFLHFLWNLTVSFPVTYLFGLLFMIAAIVTFFVMFNISVKHERKLMLVHLADENIPSMHKNILSTTSRNYPGWVEESIRKEYIKCTTKLAFRKEQVKFLEEGKRELYSAEIDLLRQRINALLTGNISPMDNPIPD